MTELKPCPFCGRQPETYFRDDNNTYIGGVLYTVACYCADKSTFPEARAVQRAVGRTLQNAKLIATQKWNTRVGDGDAASAQD